MEAQNYSNTDTLKILIADDDADDREFLKFIFDKHPGFEVTGTVSDAAAVIAHINGSNNLPDVLLTDMYMPEMDGAELTMKLLQKLETGRTLQIFIISGIDNWQVEEKFTVYPNVKFLAKPRNLSEINDIPELLLEKLNRGHINRI